MHLYADMIRCVYLRIFHFTSSFIYTSYADTVIHIQTYLRSYEHNSTATPILAMMTYRIKLRSALLSKPPLAGLMISSSDSSFTSSL